MLPLLQSELARKGEIFAKNGKTQVKDGEKEKKKSTAFGCSGADHCGMQGCDARVVFETAQKSRFVYHVPCTAKPTRTREGSEKRIGRR